jgi:hypothetical protein
MGCETTYTGRNVREDKGDKAKAECLGLREDNILKADLSGC